MTRYSAPFEILSIFMLPFDIKFIFYCGDTRKFGRSTFARSLIFKFEISAILKFYCSKFRPSPELIKKISQLRTLQFILLQGRKWFFYPSLQLIYNSFQIIYIQILKCKKIDNSDSWSTIKKNFRFKFIFSTEKKIKYLTVLFCQDFNQHMTFLVTILMFFLPVNELY